MKFANAFLLPLREKVSTQSTDEGSHRPFNRLRLTRSSTPHPTRCAGHLLPQGEKD
jgi:hypothetical protein